MSLDNYADLLALGGIVKDSAVCSACGSDSAPLRPEALWLGHNAGRDEHSGTSLLCVRHAADWAGDGHVALAS
ncbi:hypothetical protein [Demequina mangrovi]|uniref:Uncharacterized protein n=1 Tax=Demequina mangrovi TaxID=1043493 RepID=A0A1H6ZKD0_9MICO|nr:hypothetical protein [Demequina mangrovi]SEJ52007.1 hypothetical protein SAMN05421637_2119 [Demequina mangrovi]